MEKPAKLSPDLFVYREMFEAILAQRLLPGTKLTEGNLSSIFKVSRAVVRSALLRLANDRIVDIQPNKGASVCRPTVKQAREIFQARRIIEAAIVQHTANNAANLGEGFKDLRNLVCEERDRFADHNRSGGIRISGDFHLQLAELADNTTLSDILNRLVPQTSLIISLYEKPGLPCCSHEEHFGLIDSISTGKTAEATTLMDQHLINIENRLLLSDEQPPTDLNEIFAHLG